MNWRKLLWPALALTLLLIFNWFFTPGFFVISMRQGHLYGSLVDVLNRAAPVMLISLGMTLVIATGGIDLSVGAVTAIAGAVAAVLANRASGSPPLFLLIALPLISSALAGMLNGSLVAGVGVQPIIATLILMVSGRGLAQLITNEQILTIDDPMFQFLGRGFFLGLPFSITVVVIAFVVTHLLMRATAIGLFIESIGGNETASRFCGVNVRIVKLAVYTFSGICAGAAGLIYTADLASVHPARIGLYTELDAILAVVVGGTSLTGGRFTLLGTLLGALLMQALNTTILSLGIQQHYALIVKAAVILAVCVLQSDTVRQALRFERRRA